TAPFALAAIGADAEEAVPDLVKALKHEDEMVRARSAYALGEIGKGAKGAVEALTAALADPKPTVRVHAAQSLWAIEGKAEAEVRVRRDLVEAKGLPPPLRTSAAETLGKIGPKAKGADGEAAVTALMRAAGEQEESLRAAAVQGLGTLGTHARKA